MINHWNMFAMLKDLVQNESFVLVNAGAPSASTGANFAGKGTLLIDKTNAKLYINTGTKAIPTWTVVGTQT